MKDKLLISACLTGENCKYNGGNNLIDKLNELKEKFDLIPICPEQLGGLTTPRAPSEISNNKVINSDGIDVTSGFKKGAESALQIAIISKCNLCLLKERSPSCGVKFIYNGEFSGDIVSGSGITTTILKRHGFKVYSEEEIEEILS